THYKEFEFSPHNVIFDAAIVNEPGQKLSVDTSWDMAGLLTKVYTDDNGYRYYEISFPVASFDTPPTKGTEWKINLYRIDTDVQGRRHYWAWSPTGVINFHTPARFGTLVFE